MGQSGEGPVMPCGVVHDRPLSPPKNVSCLPNMTEHVNLVALLTRYGELAAELDKCTDPGRAKVLRQQLADLDRHLDAAQQLLHYKRQSVSPLGGSLN